MRGQRAGRSGTIPAGFRYGPVSAAGKFSRRPALRSCGCRHQGEAPIDLADIELLRVEVVSAPFEQFVMALMLWVRDSLQELVIAPRPPTRTPPGAFAEPGIGAAWRIGATASSTAMQHQPPP